LGEHAVGLATRSAPQDPTSTALFNPRDHACFPCFNGLRALAALGVLLAHPAYASHAANTAGFGEYLSQLNARVFDGGWRRADGGVVPARAG
jgi:peptidoglycan/LPS O-acetylase OafA/YrhL